MRLSPRNRLFLRTGGLELYDLRSKFSFFSAYRPMTRFTKTCLWRKQVFAPAVALPIWTSAFIGSITSSAQAKDLAFLTSKTFLKKESYSSSVWGGPWCSKIRLGNGNSGVQGYSLPYRQFSYINMKNTAAWLRSKINHSHDVSNFLEFFMTWMWLETCFRSRTIPVRR